MKHGSKSGKRAGPTGYRTASSFLHRKIVQTKRIRHRLRKPGIK